MGETFKTSRERAEAAFSRAQSQSLARNRTISENDAIVRARDEKTSRLRALRLAKEADDLTVQAEAEKNKPNK